MLFVEVVSQRGLPGNILHSDGTFREVSIQSAGSTNHSNNFEQDAITRYDLKFYGGTGGAILPFLFFVIGVVWLALSGAPDERGFWPILVGALALSMLLSRDKTTFSKVVIDGMSRPILMIMIMAWMLASIIGVLMNSTGFVEALIWVAGLLKLSGVSFVVVTFLICCIVSASTGTSFGTILICGPILYPAGGLLGSDLAVLAGAVLGGATFGDSISPISDTTIASALTQKADIGGTVRSRLKYVIPAASLALILYAAAAWIGRTSAAGNGPLLEGDPRGLPMLIVPVVVIILLLSGRHLLEGLLVGLVVGVTTGLSFGLLEPSRLLSLDPEHFTARSLIIEGIERAVGISVFTIFLLGLVAALEASGILKRLVDFSARRSHSVRSAEVWIVAVVSGAVLLTTHSIVAILTAGEFASETGRRFSIHRYRRANLLDLTVSTFPFLLPYFIPVILVANTTSSGKDFGIPQVSPLDVGLHNFHSWMVMLVVIFALITGFGRRFASDAKSTTAARVGERPSTE